MFHVKQYSKSPQSRAFVILYSLLFRDVMSMNYTDKSVKKLFNTLLSMMKAEESQIKETAM